jgi:hypothetical protein
LAEGVDVVRAVTKAEFSLWTAAASDEGSVEEDSFVRALIRSLEFTKKQAAEIMNRVRDFFAERLKRTVKNPKLVWKSGQLPIHTSMGTMLQASQKRAIQSQACLMSDGLHRSTTMKSTSPTAFWRLREMDGSVPNAPVGTIFRHTISNQSPKGYSNQQSYTESRT